jgi:hypothetical protein
MARCMTFFSDSLRTLALVLLVVGLLAVPNQATLGDDDPPIGPPVTCINCGGYCEVGGWCDPLQQCANIQANCTCVPNATCDSACKCLNEGAARCKCK